jgi:RimJ/RimL family protein N-acetyltransferase
MKSRAPVKKRVKGTMEKTWYTHAMKSTPLELTDKVILLRPFELKDAEEHLAGEDEAQKRWLSGGKSTLETVSNWIRRNQESWEKGGPIFSFAIVDAKTHALVGMVEANTDHESVEGIQKGEANVSYGLYPFARRKVYASRAVNLMLGFLLRRGLHAAIILVDSGNEDSLKVPLRCGFKELDVMQTSKKRTFVIFRKLLDEYL